MNLLVYFPPLEQLVFSLIPQNYSNTTNLIKWDTFFFLIPETQIILIICTLLIAYSLIMSGKRYNTLLNYISDISLFSLFSIYLTLLTQPFNNNTVYYLFDGIFEVSLSTLILKKLIIFITFFILYISKIFLKNQKGLFFEYYILFLCLTLGAFIAISANDFLILYLGLEMQSLAATVLACFDGKHMGNEAGLKYFLVGCLSSGLLLFGFALISSTFGTQNLTKISLHSFFLIKQKSFLSSYMYCNTLIGLFCILIGFLIKLGVAPFHLWVADVYEGSLLPVAIYFATVQKLVTFVIFIKLFKITFIGFEFLIQPFVILTAICSMIFGGMLAGYTFVIKRFLAFSSITHMGLILLGFSFSNNEGLQVSILYFIIYLIVTISAWFSIMYTGLILDEQSNNVNIKYINDLTLFAKSEPFLGVIIITNLFSMAGIPPVAGFFAKSYLLASLINQITSINFISVFMNNNDYITFLYIQSCFISIFISIIAGFYYLKLIKEIYSKQTLGKKFRLPNLVYKNILIITFFINIFGFIIYDLAMEYSTQLALLISI